MGFNLGSKGLRNNPETQNTRRQKPGNDSIYLHHRRNLKSLQMKVAKTLSKRTYLNKRLVTEKRYIQGGSTIIDGYRCSSVVKVLCHKSEVRWFDPTWCHWKFPLT